MLDVTLNTYFLTPACEMRLTTPEGVHAAVNGLMVSRASNPNGIPNRVVKHHPKRTASVLVHICKAFLRTHHFPQVSKHHQVISII
jgi:hypothetical protein